ncbi:MAG TPA: hypothetical protein VHB70_11600 [Parafilimonas sp.]|nr:hypothetical protein [Parafilimonas sp.]
MRKFSILLLLLTIAITSCKKNNDSPSSAVAFEADIDGAHWEADSVFAFRAPFNAPPGTPAYFEIEAKKNDGSYIFLQSLNDTTSVITFKQTIKTFTGKIDIPDSSYITLDWQTVNENNTKRFVVERSYDGLNFDSIGSVIAVGTGDHSYSFSEKPPMVNPSFNILIYYRLKIIDNDNSYVYSVIVANNLSYPALYIFPLQHDYAVGYNGTMSVTSIDKQKKIISGNFNFSYTDDGSHKHLKITSGKFVNVHYK